MTKKGLPAADSSEKLGVWRREEAIVRRLIAARICACARLGAYVKSYRLVPGLRCRFRGAESMRGIRLVS